MTRIRSRLSAILQSAALLCSAQVAAAASLDPVASFGNNPSNALMYVYVPDSVAPPAPILVALHYCGGSASAYFDGTGYRALSDQYGFIVIYGEAPAADKCWDVHSDATLQHGGGSDSAGIVSMVSYAVAQLGGNADRVYVTGTSSGAMMTNVLLGAYPDVFKGGAAFAGVPYACFAGPGAWNNACADGQVTKTGQEWGDLVRAAYPGYSGPRPRVQLWHGSIDEILDFHNFGEAIKQWTNVLGVSETPTSTEQNTPQAGFVRTRYSDAGGVVRVEAVREEGVVHNLTVPADEVIRFFGLDGPTDPGGGSGGGEGGNGSGGANTGGAPANAGGSSGLAGNGGASGGNPGAGGTGGTGAGGATMIGAGGSGTSVAGHAGAPNAAGAGSNGAADPGCGCRSGAGAAPSANFGIWALALLCLVRLRRHQCG